MTARSEAERLAAEWLPCTSLCYDYPKPPGTWHSKECVAFFRPAIATALESQMLVAELARDSALEEAAAACEKLATPINSLDEPIGACACAGAVRALKTKNHGGTNG